MKREIHEEKDIYIERGVCYLSSGIILVAYQERMVEEGNQGSTSKQYTKNRTTYQMQNSTGEKPKGSQLLLTGLKED